MPKKYTIKVFPDDMLPQEKATWVLIIVLCVLTIIFITLYFFILPPSIPDNAYADVFNSTITTLNGGDIMKWQLNNTTDTLYNWVPLETTLTFAPIGLAVIIIIIVIFLPIRERR